MWRRSYKRENDTLHSVFLVFYLLLLVDKANEDDSMEDDLKILVEYLSN